MEIIKTQKDELAWDGVPYIDTIKTKNIKGIRLLMWRYSRFSCGFGFIGYCVFITIKKNIKPNMKRFIFYRVPRKLVENL